MKKILLIAVLASCTPQSTKSAVDVTIKIADSTCKEEASDPNEPEWVKVACAVENGIVHIILPRTQWAMRKRIQ